MAKDNDNVFDIARRQAELAQILESAKNQTITLEDFYAYGPEHCYIYLPLGDKWSVAGVNGQLPWVKIKRKDGTYYMTKPRRGEPQPFLQKPSAWLDAYHPCQQLVWAPGQPQIIKDCHLDEDGWFDKPGATTLNLYRKPQLEKGDARGADRWVELVQKIYREDAEHIFNVLAFKVQHPGVKINHALVLGGAPGIGKDTILEPVRWGIGRHNCQEIGPHDLLGQFNGFAQAIVLRISEARDLGDVNRRQFYERSKTYIAAPPNMLRCNPKYQPQRSVMNVVLVIITTNYKTTGLYLPANDRRHYVAWSPLKEENFTSQYWTEFWDWYLEGGGILDVVQWLKERDLSAFNPKASPPKTDAFWEIADASQPGEQTELAELIERLGNPAALTLFDIKSAADFESSTSWMNEPGNKRLLPHHLEQCGYVMCRNTGKGNRWRIGDKQQTMYVQKELTSKDQFAAAEARRDAGPSPLPRVTPPVNLDEERARTPVNLDEERARRQPRGD